MTRTTPKPPVDLAREIPGIAEFARPTTRLHPRPGEPSAQDSHLGGPLLWPADEAWPRCARQQDLPEGSGIPERPVAEVAVAQLYARDVPSLPFPPGKDLLQVLWCPNDHDEPEYGFAPAVDIFWRNSAEVKRVLAKPPTPEISEEEYFPAPCVLDPEVVTEYPFYEVLPAQLAEAVERFGPSNAYQYLLSVAPGCKTGGWVSWAVTDLIAMNCTECDSPMDLLLTIDSSEWDAGTESRWRPAEDTDDEPEEETNDETETRSNRTPTNLMIKDALRIFFCPKDVAHPIQQDMQ
jgi:hypothetical protein